MKKKTLSSVLLWLSLLAAYVPITLAHGDPHPGDVNADGAVNIVDAGSISARWTGPPAGPLGYDVSADINLGGPDGVIDVMDAAVVSAYWDGPPLGPLHPPM